MGCKKARITHQILSMVKTIMVVVLILIGSFLVDVEAEAQYKSHE